MKKLSALMISLALLFSLGTPAMAAETAKATSLRLASSEGTVRIENKNGRKLTAKNEMKLYSGYTVKTAAASYAYISLDDSKAIKLDASSSVEIRKSGKKLQVLLKKGKLFFNVSKPLEHDESLEIRTSTIVTGVRGTAGVLSQLSSDQSALDLLDGLVTLPELNPVTGETIQREVKPGQRAIASMTSGSSEANAPSLQLHELTNGDVAGFVAQEIKKDEKLREHVSLQTKLDVEQIAKNADSTLAADQKSASEQLAKVEEAIAKEAPPKNTQPTHPAEPPKVEGGGSSDGNSGGTPSTPTPPTPPLPDSITLSGTVTQAQLEAALLATASVILADEAKLTLTSGAQVSIPSGKELKLERGSELTIAQGASLSLSGSILNYGTLNLSGVLEIPAVVAGASAKNANETPALLNKGSFISGQTGDLRVSSPIKNNAGATWTNEGSMTLAALLNNKGSFINGETGDLRVSSPIENNAGATWTNEGSMTLAAPFDNKGGVLNRAAGDLQVSSPIENGASATWANEGSMTLAAPFDNKGTFLMMSGLVSNTMRSTDETSLPVIKSVAGGIRFENGIFSSLQDPVVIPLKSFARGFVCTLGSQNDGETFIMGNGIRNTVASVGDIATTIFIVSANTTLDELVIESEQKITLEFYPVMGDENTKTAYMRMNKAIVNKGTLKLTLKNSIPEQDTDPAQLGRNAALTSEGDAVIQNTGTLHVAIHVSSEGTGGSTILNKGVLEVASEGKIFGEYCAIENRKGDLLETGGTVSVDGLVSSSRLAIWTSATQQDVLIEASGIVELLEDGENNFAIDGPFGFGDTAGTVRSKYRDKITREENIPSGYQVSPSADTDGFYRLEPIPTL